MPVLESTDNLTPRSALRHRPIGDEAAKSGKEPVVPSTATTPVAQRASRLRQKQTDGAEDINEWQRVDTDDTERSHTTATPRQTGTKSKKLPKVPRPQATQGKRKFWHGWHPLLYLGIGMIAMLAMWTLLTTAISWWNITWDDIHYGRPRTFQIDAFVGHNESAGTSSHFIDVNGDHQQDMIIHFQSSRIVFINDQGGFRPLRPEERHSVEQFLQRTG